MIINQQVIKQYISKPLVPTVITLDQISSTNAYCKVHDNLSVPLILTANAQTNAYGKFEHKFFSAKNHGLYLSIVLPVHIYYLFNPEILTIKIGAVLANKLVQYTHKAIKIKWINDIYLNNKKIGGILVETKTNNNGSVSGFIIGIGLNLQVKKFPGSIKSKAGNLLQENEDFDVNKFIADLYVTIIKNYYFIRNFNIFRLYKCYVYSCPEFERFFTKVKLRTGVLL